MFHLFDRDNSDTMDHHARIDKEYIVLHYEINIHLHHIHLIQVQNNLFHLFHHPQDFDRVLLWFIDSYLKIAV
jgi:hypothetical protein